MGARKALDQALDNWASEYISQGRPYKWWWNADDTIALLVSAAARHLRKEGMAAYSHNELKELKRMENLFGSWFDAENAEMIEAVDLLSKWFTRLWD